MEMGLLTKKFWLVAVFFILLLGAVLVRHVGKPPSTLESVEEIQKNQSLEENSTSGVTAHLGPPQAAKDSAPSANAEDAQAPEVTPHPIQPGTDPQVPEPQPDVSAEALPASPADSLPSTPLSPPEDLSAVNGEEGAMPGEEVVKGTVEKGDTFGKILENTGSEGVYQYISAAQQVFSLRTFREGQPYAIVTDSTSGRVKRFEYEIDSRRRLVVEGDQEPVARLEAIEYVTLLGVVETSINDNLFQAVADAGESPQMALQLAELFGAEINFIRDLQEGDSFSVLVEKRYRDGEYKGYGRILAAHFTNKGKTFEAYLFRSGSGRAEYYNRKGENLRKTLLQAPLAFTRLTSRFTQSRKHPILGKSRPHLGVDYGAPTGTPVKAVGDGVVTKKGWAGGYGNQIIVKHVAGLESMYSHLSGYARGLRNGLRVRQGQVIGFVGSTGLSTGPHLDFRLRQNGKFINPTKAINPRGAPVPAKQMAAFEKVVLAELDYLKGLKPLAEYEVDSVVQENPVLVDGASDEKEKKDESQKRRRKS